MAGRTYLKVAFSISIFLVATGWAGAVAETIYLEVADGPYASNPIPADGELIDGHIYMDNIYTILEFTPGDGDMKHTAYFSDDPARVAARDPNVSLGAPPIMIYPNRYYVGLPPYTDSLVRGVTYFWCVDETDAMDNTYPGDIWEFTVRDYKASFPDPPDEATFIETDVLLSWEPGYGAAEHDVYLGTSYEAVRDARYDFNEPAEPNGSLYVGPDEYLITRTEPNVMLTDIAYLTQHYWRVDEVHNRMPPPFGGGIYYFGPVCCFTTVPEGLGTIRMDLWWNMIRPWPPWPIIPLPNLDPGPDETRFLTSFDSGEYLGENYVGRIHGWLHPSKSGDYTFWIASDDDSELFLSTDERPVNMERIAYVKSYTSPYEWYDPGELYQQSVPTPLVAGRKYYIMAHWQEQGGGDHCMVAWQGPDQPLAPIGGSADAIIPGSRLSPFVQYCAYNPDPFDSQTDVALPVTLRWEKGDYAAQHDVYIGTDKALVESRDGSTYMERVSIRRYDPIELIPSQTYYWAVDEVNELGPAPCIWPGDVWSFTTEPWRIYVDIDAGGANNGTSWENAYNYLQDALADANSLEKPVEICVAKGIYKPDHGKDQHLEDQYASFQLQNRVTIKGGYGGIGEPDPDARDITAYKTILSGEISDDEDSCHVVTGSGTDRTAVLDGFTITEGEAYNVSNNNDLGGGMYSYAGSPTIRNCTFTNNWALNYGGGMCNDGNSCPLLINCMFVQNSATDGGGMDNEYSHPILINCIFAGNWVDEYNADSFSGGAIYNFHSSPTLVNCTITTNVAVEWGICGGIYNSSTSHPTLINCILSENSDTNGKTESSQIFGGTLLMNYCCVQGWTGYLGGVGNMDEDPCFAKPAHWEDPCGTPGYPQDDLWIQGDLHLKSQAGRWDPNSESWVADDVTSPCIDAGNPGCPVGDEPAPNGSRRNMGAYGGTAKASKSPADWRSIADMTNDWVVDSSDLRIYVDYWLESGRCLPSDFDRSQFVDFNDFAIFGLHWSYPPASEPGITYQIVKCDPSSYRSPATEPATETRFSVIVEGSYIHFKDMMVANCCTDKLGLEMTVEDNLITIYEIEYIPGVCFCICDYPVTATLGPFEPGIYILEVYEDWGGFIGSTAVVINPPE